jgi:serine/threonine protein kinase
MSTESGIEVLNRLKLTEMIQGVGRSCNSAELVPDLVKCFENCSISNLVCQFFYEFMLTGHVDVFKSCVSELTGVINRIAEGTMIYSDVFMRYMRSNMAEDVEGKLDYFMNAVHGLWLENELCLEATARNRFLHSILQKVTRRLYSLLFSRWTGMSRGDVDAELAWWLSTGNGEYAKDFEKSLCRGMTGKVPPHLFGALAQLEQGRAKIIPHLPGLLKQMQSNSEADRNGALFAIAHFGANKATHDSLQQLQAIETIVRQWNSSSWTSKGLIISALSLVADSRYFTSVLAGHEWNLFRFGDHVVAFPVNSSQVYITFELPVSPGRGDAHPIHSLIRQLSSPITMAKAKSTLEAESADVLKRQDLALFTYQFMSEFTVSPGARMFLMQLFGSVSLGYEKGRSAVEQSVAVTSEKEITQMYQDQMPVVSHLLKDFAGMTLIRTLGKSVGLYEDPSNHEYVAIKTFNIASDSDVEVDVSRQFMNEVEMLICLTHPCFVQIVGYSLPTRSSPPKIGTKFAVNGSLRDALQKRQSVSFMDDTGIAIIVCGIVMGMRFIHSRRVLHRDLKPENVLLDEYGFVQIGDLRTGQFGDANVTLTKRVGSPHYMAPEMYDNCEYTTAIDVYSFSLILYEVVVGEPVFPLSVTLIALMNDVMLGHRPEIPNWVNETVREIITRGWSIDPLMRDSFASIFASLERIGFRVMPGVDSVKVAEYVSSVCRRELNLGSSR